LYWTWIEPLSLFLCKLIVQYLCIASKASISHPSLLTACQMALADTSGSIEH
jgi:hypothetical protein